MFLPLLKGLFHKIFKCWFFHQKSFSGPIRVSDIVKGFNRQIPARKFVKESKLVPRISILLKKKKIRKSFDTVPLIHNFLQVRMNCDNVLTV